jgi:prolyl-tRNA editing enzyme YbaK/EbsC (Cys-tRNA(Pro) deacylase)
MPSKENEEDPMNKNAIFDTISAGLIARGIAYSVIEHEPVYTMEEAQEASGGEPEQGVKVLFIRTYRSKSDFYHCLVVWTGNKPVDFQRIATVLGAKKTKLASADEVLENLGIEIGALTPFGYERSFPVIFDNSLLNQAILYINPGVHDKTIKMNPNDLLEATKSSASTFHLL